jgi:hypothetical protein
MTVKKKTTPGKSNITNDSGSRKSKFDKLAVEMGRRIVQARSGFGLSQQAVSTHTGSRGHQSRHGA